VIRVVFPAIIPYFSSKKTDADISSANNKVHWGGGALCNCCRPIDLVSRLLYARRRKMDKERTFTAKLFYRASPDCARVRVCVCVELT